MKKRGYYKIEVGERVISGHFSVNFWALMEEQLGFNSLSEVFAFMSKGVGMKEIRTLIYCSTRAYDLEEGSEPQFSNIFKCGLALEDFTEENLVEVMDAFAQSKLLGNESNFGIERGKGDSEGK